MDHLQYPIGWFSAKKTYSREDVTRLIEWVEKAPGRYERLLANCTYTDLAKTYREGSWTVRQLVHHVADIHLLNFLRIKKVLTEEDYVATLIQMNEWATTPDAVAAPVADSLLMFTGINQRLVFLVRHLDESALARTYYHPVRQMHFSVKHALHLAVWHVAHHQAHIELALGRTINTFRLD